MNLNIHIVKFKHVNFFFLSMYICIYIVKWGGGGAGAGEGGGNKRVAVVAISADSFWPCSERLVVTPDVTFSMPSHWTWNIGWIRDIYTYRAYQLLSDCYWDSWLIFMNASTDISANSIFITFCMILSGK